MTFLKKWRLDFQIGRILCGVKYSCTLHVSCYIVSNWYRNCMVNYIALCFMLLLLLWFFIDFMINSNFVVVVVLFLFFDVLFFNVFIL